MDKKYWFKRRRYGWGWTPVTWQGFLLLAGFIIILLGAGLRMPTNPNQPSVKQLLLFFGIVIADLVMFLAFTISHSPTPRWRWGKRDDDNPYEDF